MRMWVCLLLLISGAGLWAQEPPASDVRPVVKIGVILPLTGELAPVAAPLRQAMFLKLAELKKEPTRYQYQLIFENNMGEGRATAQAAERLANMDRVDFIVSLWGITGQQVNTVSVRKNIPHMNLMGWNADLADGKLKYLFGGDIRQELRLALTVFKKLGVQQPALLYANDFDCAYAARVFAQEAAQLGLTPAASLGFDSGEPDLRTVLLKIMQSRPDAFLHLSYDPDILPLEKTIQAMRWSFPVTNIESYDSLLEYPMFQGRWWVTSAAGNAQFVQKYRQLNGRDPEYGAVFAYDVVGLIAAAYEATPKDLLKPTPADLATYFAKPSYVGALGPLSVPSPGLFSAPPRLMKAHNGKAVPTTVEEIVAAAAKSSSSN